MKFDVIIIGGGLSGLICGINLAKKKLNCAIVSTGQSALHFCSGSFDLLGYANGIEVIEPLSAIASLPSSHPYSIIGLKNIRTLAERVKPLLAQAKIKVNGSTDKNHYRITPMGILKPTWLSLDDFTVITDKDILPWKKISIQNISGFLDFHTSFIADGLEKLGAVCQIASFSMPELEHIQKNPTGMRSANIAKVFEDYNILKRLALIVEEKSLDADCIILPAVFGLYSMQNVEILRTLINKSVCLLPALPPSVPGIRTQIMIQEYFQQLGGTYMLGDTVTDGKFEGNKLKYISTINHGDIKLESDNFVLATGSFFSHGIAARPNSIYEPIFNLDVNAEVDRSKWYDPSLFKSQPYMSYGIATDSEFHARLNGESIDNLFVSGSALSGYNPLTEASGAGVSLLTAMYVADKIGE